MIVEQVVKERVISTTTLQGQGHKVRNKGQGQGHKVMSSKQGWKVRSSRNQSSPQQRRCEVKVTKSDTKVKVKVIRSRVQNEVGKSVRRGTNHLVNNNVARSKSRGRKRRSRSRSYGHKVMSSKRGWRVRSSRNQSPPQQRRCKVNVTRSETKVKVKVIRS